MSASVILIKSLVADYCNNNSSRHQERTMPETVFLFCKLLSVLFLAYFVLQSISGKPCYGFFRYCTSPENLVYEIGKQDIQIDARVAEVDHFDFFRLHRIVTQPFITLWCYVGKPEILPLYTPYDSSILSTRSPPLPPIC
jgi:hypothetical protein